MLDASTCLTTTRKWTRTGRLLRSRYARGPRGADAVPGLASPPLRIQGASAASASLPRQVRYLGTWLGFPAPVPRIPPNANLRTLPSLPVAAAPALAACRRCACPRCLSRLWLAMLFLSRPRLAWLPPPLSLTSLPWLPQDVEFRLSITPLSLTSLAWLPLPLSLGFATHTRSSGLASPLTPSLP